MAYILRDKDATEIFQITVWRGTCTRSVKALSRKNILQA